MVDKFGASFLLPNSTFRTFCVNCQSIAKAKTVGDNLGMKFLVVVAVFLLVAEPAYVGTVSERSMEDVPVSSGECLKVLENGNFIKQNNEKFYRVIYEGHSYVVTVKYMGLIRHYSCDTKMKLIKN